MVICSAYSCNSNSSFDRKIDNISYHRFPKDVNLLNTWLANMRHSGFQPTVNHSSRLCSLHFEPNCFYKTIKNKTFLEKDAIPTIFSKFPEYLPSKKVVPRRSPSKTAVASTFGTASMSAESDKSAGNGQLKVKRSQMQEFSGEKRKRKSTSGTAPISATAEEFPENRKLEMKQFQVQKNCTEKRKRKKMKVSDQSVEIYKTPVVSLEYMLACLKKNNLLLEEKALLLENMNNVSKEFVNKKQSWKGPFTQELRKFVVALNFFSPKAYEYAREFFDSCLPHPGTISKWFQSTNAEPGFTREALRTLEISVKSAGRKLVGAVIMDHISIRKHLEWDGKKFWGQANFGVEFDDDNNDLAKQAFVIMVVGINTTWKLPIGYFLTDSLNSSQMQSLMKHAIQLVQDTGVQVVSMTCDGSAANLSMYDLFGCINTLPDLKTYFELNGKNVYFFYDSCHMLELVRNTFREKKIFIDKDGDEINWKFIDALLELQESNGVHLTNKLRKQHKHFFQQKMKLRLAVQLFSNSLADTLEYCLNILQISKFEGCEGTVQFIRIINSIFDILNCRATGSSKPICKENYDSVVEYVSFAQDYIANLKYTNFEPIIESKGKTGFIGLIMSMNSALLLYKDLVIEQQLCSHLPLYKVSQDHLELFLSTIRSKSGWDDDPTALQFMEEYKRLVVRTDIRKHLSEDPLEVIPILTMLSRTEDSTEDNINVSSSRVRQYRTNFVPLDIILQDHNYLINNYTMSECCEQMVVFIGGFVVKHLQLTVQCESCISALSCDKENFLNSLINQNSEGGLVYPSDDVIKICKKTESFFKIAELEGVIYKRNAIYKICNSVLMFFSDTNIFSIINSHAGDTAVNHLYYLAQAVSMKYLNIRFHFINKKSGKLLDNFRSSYSKAVLFNE